MSDEKPTSSKGSEAGHSNSAGGIESMRQLLADKLSLFSVDSDDSASEKVIEELTFDGLIKHWKKEGFKNIITMAGAGISTSAGIPDFRSPDTGLYSNLQKYNLPHPSAIFDLDYFLDNPKPFFALAKELYPGTFNPTPAHYFVRLLHEKGLLLRHYTQNIDTLERIAGIPDEKLVEAHGTFYNNRCMSCNELYSMSWMKEKIFADVLPTCEKCRSIVKPGIVFFGENLPHKFYMLQSRDFDSCDLLIIMGTSLEVQPFASLVDRAGPRCVRLLINRTMVGREQGLFSWFESEPSLLYKSPRNTRDIAYIGDCDDGVMALVKALGWAEELKEFMERGNEALRLENKIYRMQKSSKSEASSSDAEKRTASPEKRSSSPEKRSSSPEKWSASPEKWSSSPEKRSSSPEKRSSSPEKRSSSPEKRSSSPEKRSSSPEKRSSSPEKRTSSPEKGTLSPEKRTGDAPEKQAASTNKTEYSSQKEKKDA